MTIRLNFNNDQTTTIKQLKSAQDRAEKRKQQIEIQKPQENQHQNQRKQTNNPYNIDALNHIATQNILQHKELSATNQQNAFLLMHPKENSNKRANKISELEIIKTEISTKEKKLTEQKGDNPSLKGLKENPLFEKLPQEIKSRGDIQQLIQNTDEYALLDPDKAVQSLVDQALMGNKQAFMKLNEYSKNQFEKLKDNAGKGMEKVAAGADGKPKVLEMIAGSATDKSNEAAAKLMHLVDKNPRAQQGFDRLLRNNAINFTKVATEAKNIDPASTASSINKLMTKGNLSKTDKKGAVEILGQIAKESPTGAGSKDAAKGLTRAVMNEPMDIAKKAAVELKEATLNGNANALSGLQTIAKSNDSSKAQLGLTQLGEIAKSGASSATESMTSIKEAAQDPTNSGKSKKMAVSILSNISNTNGTNSKEALNTLSSITTNKNNPANDIAFNEIGKTSDSKISNSFKTTNAGKQNSLSDSETYKKLMNLQTQMNSLSQKPDNFLNAFGSKLFQT